MLEIVPSRETRLKTMKPVSRMIYFLKIFTAGILSLIILSLLLSPYYTIGTTISDDYGATYYKGLPNEKISRATEGYFSGKLDSNGYNNLAVPERIDILLMGSSHMEALQVGQNKNTASVLQDYLRDSMTVYNIGSSGHYFINCASNMINAINTFLPQKYLIIETPTVELDMQEMRDAISGSRLVSKQEDDNIIEKVLKKSAFINLLNLQIQSYIDTKFLKTKTKASIDDKDGYAETLDILLMNMEKLASSKNVKLIILFHPLLYLAVDGSAYVNTNNFYLNTFENLCKNNSIVFVDMTATFLKNYNSKYILPNGFSNTEVGKGHLNEDGHLMIAEKLFEVISSIEN